MNWIPLIKEMGPYLGIMFFFIWRDFRREERLEERITSLNNFIQTELMDLIDKTNKALEYAKKPQPDEDEQASPVRTET